MFQQIIQCGVLQASPEHQIEWLDETMQYLAERYHELVPAEMADLRVLGVRFCQPPKARQAGEPTPESTPEMEPVEA